MFYIYQNIIKRTLLVTGLMSQINQEFSTKVKTWTACELKYQELKGQLNRLAETRDQLSEDMIKYIKANNLQQTAINVGGHRICYYDESQYNNLSFIFLKECLMVYFNNDEAKTNQLCDFIKSKRKKTYKPGLKIMQKKQNAI